VFVVAALEICGNGLFTPGGHASVITNRQPNRVHAVLGH
jgi:hypothetical protein